MEKELIGIHNLLEMQALTSPAKRFEYVARVKDDLERAEKEQPWDFPFPIVFQNRG